MRARDKARLEAMARAVANALTGGPVVWEALPEATRRIFLNVARAAHAADRIAGPD